MKPIHLAILGATGAVGREACALLAERRIAVKELTLLASPRSKDASIGALGRAWRVQVADEHSFRGVDYAIFSAGAERSRHFAPIAQASGAVVIDNSAAFRMEPQVPLVVPEVNAHALARHNGLIANPNCSTILLAVAVCPLHRVNPVRRIVVSTYQAASGAGAAAVQELRTQTADVLAGRPAAPRVFPHPIAFNLFSHDSTVDDDGYNGEERKMIEEMRKIFAVPELSVSPTCIRVPIERCHSESVNLTFERPMSPDEARRALAAAPGVRVMDDAARNHFPMPVEAAGRDEVLVGRIRQDSSLRDGRGLNLFLCGDQLRKGAALNALQILELLAG